MTNREFLNGLVTLQIGKPTYYGSYSIFYSIVDENDVYIKHRGNLSTVRVTLSDPYPFMLPELFILEVRNNKINEFLI